MKPAICSQCGAQIEINENGNGVCSFCNTAFILEDNEQAKFFNSGLEHLKLGNFHEATEKFKQAFEIYPKAEYKLYYDIAQSRNFQDIAKILSFKITCTYGKGLEYKYDGAENACFDFIIKNASGLQKERWLTEFDIDFTNNSTAFISLIKKVLFNKELLTEVNVQTLSIVFKKITGEVAEEIANIFTKFISTIKFDGDLKNISILFSSIKNYLSESVSQEIFSKLKSGKNLILDGIWTIDFPLALTEEHGVWTIPNGVKYITFNLNVGDNSFAEFLKRVKKVVIPPTLENSLGGWKVDFVEFSEGCTQENILKLFYIAKKAVFIPSNIKLLEGQLNKKLLYDTNLFIISKTPFSNKLTYVKDPFFSSNGNLAGFFTCIMDNHLFYENSYLDRLNNIKNFYKSCFGNYLPENIVVHPIHDWTKIGNEPQIIENFNKKQEKKNKVGFFGKLFGRK